MEQQSTDQINLAVIILTKNEERHIERAIDSIKEVAQHILVVDSGSTDQTVSIAKQCGAKVVEKPWINYATQFNWALDQLPENTAWVMRLDADEVVQANLRQQIRSHLGSLPDEVNAVYLNRSMRFLGDDVKRGGLFPISVIRIFRYGKAHCENRWMDEHIVADGETVQFSGQLIDDNLNTLSWWTDKHNAYASREVIDILMSELASSQHESIGQLKKEQAKYKRWIKENVYNRAPIGARALAYFIYRYIFRLGILDTPGGRKFHILQGFWYRYLVDAKLAEVKKLIKDKNITPEAAILQKLQFDVQTAERK